MASNIRSWGILGNPSKEKINEYKNMPVGSFKNMVKNLSRGKKGKVLQSHEVYVIKKNIDVTRGLIKVDAFTLQEAFELARIQHEQIKWDEQPYATDRVEYSYQSYDPLKYKTG